MARKKTATADASKTNQNPDSEAAKRGEENLNEEDQSEEDDDLNENDDDIDDSDDDDDNPDDELSEQDKDFEEAHGFPPRTKEKDMTLEQQLAYNKFHLNKWEKRSKAATKAFDGLTPEEVERLRAVETEHKELLANKTSDTDADKAVEEAKLSVRKKFVPLLVAAKLQALTEGRIEEEKLQKLLSRMSIDDFVTDDGEFDNDAIKEFADDFFPATVPASKRRSQADHLGHRDHSGAPPKSDYEKGIERAKARRGTL